MRNRIPCINSNGSFSVEVQLKNASNVFLVDKSNYQKYINGQRFKYFGGYYDKTPVRISVNKSGEFYLIVSSSSYSYELY